jgi:outer membrane immunogenic protein
MKRILMAGAVSLVAAGTAVAADLPPPNPMPPPRAPATYVPAPMPVFTWAGVYLGGNAGYGFGTASGGGASVSTNGFLGGGQIGANGQWGSFVAGIEGDADYNGIKGGGVSSTYLSTLRARAGWAWDRVLFYGTAGGALENVNVSGLGNAGTAFGWTAGAGIEAALTPNWTAKVEYLYVSATPSISGTSIKDTDNVIRAGINYKFNLW